MLRYFLLLNVFFATSCDSKTSALSPSGGISPGAWKITIKPPKSVESSQIFCVSEAAARNPSLPVLLNFTPKKSDYKSMIKLNHGIIKGSSKIDTPDGDIRNIPVHMEGSYNADSYDIVETMTLYGILFKTQWHGEKVGQCDDAAWNEVMYPSLERETRRKKRLREMYAP